MSDQMERLGRMVDEAPSQAGAEQKPASAPASALASEPGTPSAERYAPRVLGGGTLHQAVDDVCWIYQDRDLAENLRRHSWRKARRKVMRQGPLEREWISHRGRPPVRLTRGGVEVKLSEGVQTQSWERMQSQVRARRS
jgi:hypothetical protein